MGPIRHPTPVLSALPSCGRPNPSQGGAKGANEDDEDDEEKGWSFFFLLGEGLSCGLINIQIVSIIPSAHCFFLGD
jgi:hypothetical protein